MTRDLLNRNWDVIKAFKEGIDIQFLNADNKWMDILQPSFSPHTEYRVKPTPELIPFDFTDVSILVCKVVESKLKKKRLYNN